MLSEIWSHPWKEFHHPEKVNDLHSYLTKYFIFGWKINEYINKKDACTYHKVWFDFCDITIANNGPGNDSESGQNNHTRNEIASYLVGKLLYGSLQEANTRVYIYIFHHSLTTLNISAEISQDLVWVVYLWGLGLLHQFNNLWQSGVCAHMGGLYQDHTMLINGATNHRGTYDN